MFTYSATLLAIKIVKEKMYNAIVNFIVLFRMKVCLSLEVSHTALNYICMIRDVK